MLITRFLRRPLGLVVFFTLFGLAIIFLPGTRPHVLQPAIFHPNLVSGLQTLDSEDVASICHEHGFSPYQRSEPKRKVYDLFLFAQELEWLEIRLNTLAPYVDYFVIVEATNTFTALPKPLILRENWDKFAAFHSKMLYFVVEDTVHSGWTWDHEDFIRDALLYGTFPRFTKEEQGANDGDVLILSDIDEIPKPETMIILRHCDFPARLTLRSHFYYYSFQYRHHGEQWAHPQATVYHGMENTISPNDLRNGEGGPGWLYLRPLVRWWQKADLWSATWHCSSCFSTIKAMQTKMDFMSHTPWNTAENRDPRTIVQRVRNGLDLFGRKGEMYDRIDGNKDVPKYILEHENMFGHMLNRDGENAAFLDYFPDQ